MRLLPRPRPGTVVKVGAAAGAAAVGAAVLGAIAFATVALGALAVGKFAIGRLKPKLGPMEKLHVGELTVDHLIVRNRTDD